MSRPRPHLLSVLVLGAAALAGPAMAAGADPRVSESLVLANAGQGEPEVALDPTKPGTIVVSLNTVGVATSHDAGRTWRKTSLPNQGDTVVTADAAGHFYYSSLDGDVQESRDHGDHWTSVGNWVGALAAQWSHASPDVLKNAGNFRFVGCNSPAPFRPVEPGAGPGFHVIPCDRPWLTADAIIPGRLQVSFVDHSAGSGGDVMAEAECPPATPTVRYAACGRQFVSVSHDAGRSWGPFRPVDGSEAPAALTNGFAGPVFSQRGILAGAYIARRMLGSHCYPCVVLALSSNEGRTWSRRQVPIIPKGGDLDPGNEGPKIGPGTSVAFEPYLAQAPGFAGRYAVALFDDSQASLLVFTTRNFGRSWQGSARLAGPPGTRGRVPWIAYGPKGALGAMWKSQSPDGSTFETWAAVAPDGTARFRPRVRLNSVVSRGPAEKAAYDDASGAAVDGTAVHAVWGDWRDPSAIAVYYGRYSFS